MDTTKAPRPSYPALGVAAKGIVRRDDGAVLLIRRAAQSSSDPGFWDLPGGKMGYGERLVDALVREVREETGLDVVPGPPFHVCHFTKEPFWVTCVTFVCSGPGGEVRLSDEHDEHAWLPVAHLGGRPYARGIEEQLQAFVAFERL